MVKELHVMMEMKMHDRKEHWENIYRTKAMHEVSWYQQVPATSLDFIDQFDLPGDAKIIDIGGGDSFFVDCLIDKGYKNITVLDISVTAIEKAKKRLGEKAGQVQWIVADVVAFKPMEKYDFWHDRAAFHFLTDEQEIAEYIGKVKQNISEQGILVIGTFSEQGPKKCSGLEIRQYSESTLAERLQHFFEKIKCITLDHITPSGTIQQFLFCSFRKLQLNG